MCVEKEKTCNQAQQWVKVVNQQNKHGPHASEELGEKAWKEEWGQQWEVKEQRKVGDEFKPN